VLVLAVMAFALMPIVVAHLRGRDYQDLVRAGRHAGVFSMVNALKVIFIFCVGWLITLPLWLIPPLAVLLPIFWWGYAFKGFLSARSEEHTSELQSRFDLVCRLLLEKKNVAMSNATASATAHVNAARRNPAGAAQ